MMKNATAGRKPNPSIKQRRKGLNALHEFCIINCPRDFDEERN